MNRAVLIADADPGRARRLTEACKGANLPVREAIHGAAALELALTDPPGLVVAHQDLPLVDPVKLAEILRANPRTRAVRFLFLGEEDGFDQRGAIGDVVLPSSSAPDEILWNVQALIEKQGRIDWLEVATAEEEEVTGELEDLPLADLLQLFHSSHRSGRLELILAKDQDDCVGKGDRQGWVLVRDGEVIQAEVGLVTSEKALFRMLGWQLGRFCFRPGRSDEPRVILPSTRALLVEGLRQRAEWERLASQLPPLDAEVELQVKHRELPNIVHPLTQEVLLLLELYPQVREVVDHCSFPDYQVLHTLHTLAGREIISVRRSSVVTPTLVAGDVEADGDGLFDEAQVRRVREWLQQGPANEVTRTSAKLLVASTERAVADFARLLAYVPGASLSDEMREGRIGEDDLATIGRIAVDESIHIELIHVPLGERAAPLWPLAASGALGTLFLLSGSISEVAERLKPMSDVLRRLPKSRIFHVVLLRKGERISPEELKRNLSLIDEASLFLLPLDSGKAPSALLRSLLFRVVP